MDNPQYQPQAAGMPRPEESGEQISLKEIFMAGLRKWKWIVASVLICLALGFLYLARTPKSYTASAAVEIKNDENSSSMNSALSAFSDMGLGSANANLYNEMAYFQSPDLMESVVEALGLDVSYYMRDGLKKVSPYGKEDPIKVTFENLPEGEGGSFRVLIDNDGMVTLNKFRIKKEKLPYESPKVKMGTKVKTPLGVVTVEPGPAYDPEEDYKIYVVKQPIPVAAASWSKRLKVAEQNKDGTVIDISISDQSPVRAKDVLTALIKAYNDNWILDKNQIAVSTSSFINERLGVIENELGNVDSDISSYKSEHMVPDVAATAAMYLTENQEINKKLLEINNQLQMARFLKDHLMRDVSNNSTLPVNLGIESQSVERQLSTYNDLVLQRNSLAQNSGETNPLVQDIDSRLKNLRASLASSLDNEIHSLNTDMRNVQSQQGNVNSQIQANPSQAKYLLTVERQQKVKESLYLYLLQKREENELTQAFTAYNTRIITRPAVDPNATSPRSAMILGVAFLFGLLLPFGIVYLQETSNTKVRGREDLGNISIPFLGEIPEYRPTRGDDKKKLLVVKPGDRNMINEAFRIVRTNLSFLGQNPTNVVMVSSFNPGSGKTFTTMNLALSLAIRGVRTLVIDGDMRRGSASEYVDNPHEGLSTYLSGKATDIDKLIKPCGDSNNLFVLPAGSVPPNPTELLENGRFGEAMDQLREEFTYIFVDCPPIGVIADPRIIEAISDRCIFVVRVGLFERSMVPELEKIYKEKTYKNLSLILNGSRSSEGRYGYNYGYVSAGKNYYTTD